MLLSAFSPLRRRVAEDSFAKRRAADRWASSLRHSTACLLLRALDRRLIFVRRDIGRARKVLKDNGIKVFHPQGQNFGGEFVVEVNSEDFERAKQWLIAAGIQVTYTR
jgi:hypothetical protein